MSLLYVNNKTRRFTLYHLEENQIYIRDFSGYCTYTDPNTNQPKVKQKGKFYICSKTIIFEANHQSVPLMKFKFESMKVEPKNTIQQTNQNNKKSTEFIYFTVNKIVTIKCSISSPPEPFKIFEELNHKIYIYPGYQDPATLLEWFAILHGYSKQKNLYDLEDKIYELIIKKQKKNGFNMTLIESVSQKPIHQDTNIFVRRILPLNQVYGYMFITNAKVYFEPFHSISGKAVHKIEVSNIAKLFKRRYQLIDIGLQIITLNNKSYYFSFDSTPNRNRLYIALSKNVSVNCIKEQSLDKITYLWQTKQISNYDYLMHLNQTGNRSFSDLSQYPVFPWVLSNFVDQSIDFQDYKNFRDLSKPIGALNQERLRNFLERYQDMPSPKFMYGSHYSAPGYVIGYLLRKKPEYMLKLQSGRFDKPDRLFKSIKGDWKNVMNNPTSLKQLIPEFYQNDPSFLLNQLNLDLGVRQNKKKVGDVKLPKWASTNPLRFLEIQRKALQSEYVSNHLHFWIDLIFGAKQRGPEAIKANNVFNHMTYQGMIDVESITDPIEKLGVKCQINQFGQCPKQIFKISHPPRGALIVLQSIPPQMQSFKEQQQKNYKITKGGIKNLQPTSLYSSTGKPKIKTVLSQGKYTDIKYFEVLKAHKATITKILNLSSKPNSVVTIGQDGFLKVFDIYEKTCLKSFKISQSCLSSIVSIKGDEVFATGSWDNCIYIFNIVYGSRSKPVVAHDNSISDLLYLNKKKRLVSSSWDCSIKFWRVVGTNLDNSEVFKDHDNQITCIAVNTQQTLLSFGDIEGNVISMNISEKQKIFEINLNNQKISTLNYLNNNLIASGEIEIRLIDPLGFQLTNFIIEKNNGHINQIFLDQQHLYILTTKKHLGLYDILQQKKTGNYFNDYRTSQIDKLPGEKQLTALCTSNDSTVVVIGSSTGNLYILRN